VNLHPIQDRQPPGPLSDLVEREHSPHPHPRVAQRTPDSHSSLARQAAAASRANDPRAQDQRPQRAARSWILSRFHTSPGLNQIIAKGLAAITAAAAIVAAALLAGQGWWAGPAVACAVASLVLLGLYLHPDADTGHHRRRFHPVSPSPWDGPPSATSDEHHRVTGTSRHGTSRGRPTGAHPALVKHVSVTARAPNQVIWTRWRFHTTMPAPAESAFGVSCKRITG
jgi:hypothetical protein